MLGKLLVFGASVKGGQHEKNNEECGDSWNFIGKKDFVVVAVSDGASGALKGWLGSRLATQYAIEYADVSTDVANIDEMAIDSVKYIRKKLEEFSASSNIDINDLACTLIIGIIKENKVSIAHIGDGGVVKKLGNSIEVISPPEKGEYANETSFITDKDWSSHVRLTKSQEFEALAIFTDGIERGILIKTEERYEPYAPFFKTLFKYALNINDSEKASKELKSVLSLEKFSKLSRDDKTLVVVALRNNEENF